MMKFGRRWLSALTFIGLILWIAPSIQPVSWGQEPLSSDIKGASGSSDQGSMEEAPSTSEEMPAASEEMPAAMEEAPSTSEEMPAASEEMPAAMEEAPSTSEEMPTASEEMPGAMEEAPSTSEETPAAAEEASAPTEEMPPSTSGTVAVPETPTGPQKYTIKQGDTLWDITNTYLQDSFLWPKVWKNNRYIINPDLIYPGNVIEFPGSEAAPVEVPVETAKPMVPPPPAPVEEAAPPPEPEMPVEITPPEQPAPAEKPVNMRFLASSGYILTGQKSVGVVVGSRDGRELNGQGDTAYLLPKVEPQPQVGDRFTVYRSVRKVYHPVTGRYMGDLIRILGQAEITGADPKEETVTSTLVTSYDAIHPGDLIMNPPPSEESAGQALPPEENSPLEGYIVEVRGEGVNHSQLDVVYLDKGRQQGVHSGDRFSIVRQGDKTSRFSPGNGVRLPHRIIGELQVLSVQDGTATAQIVNSKEVIYKGDRFESPASP